MGIEIIGTVASIAVLCSFLMTGEKEIRRTNIIGALMFVLYGYIVGSFSVVFLNTLLVLVHLERLVKAREAEKSK